MGLVALLLPAFRVVRSNGPYACANNLKQIGLALHMYHDEWKCLPPAYVADEQGRPMHSWRVLVLPYMEQRVLYEQYDFDEPWNSPHNLEVARQIPSVIRCPRDRQAGPTDTSYVMLVGPEALCEGAMPTTFADVTDGTSNTIAVVEMSGSGILWSEPEDLNAEEIPPEHLKALVTRAGGEPTRELDY